MGGYIEDEIELVLDGLDEFALMEVWNEYARQNERPRIYLMEDIESVLQTEFGLSLLQIIDSLDPSFNTNDECFTFDIYGDEQIRSFTDWFSPQCPYDINELIQDIAETEQGYGNPELEALFH